MKKDTVELQRLVESNWTVSAENYSNIIQKELAGFKRDAWTKLILENAPQKEKLTILDVGTGPGFFAIILTLAGHEVTAIDCTEGMVACAGKNAQAVGVQPNFCVMDSHQLAFQNENFDLIVSRNVTWTLQDAETAYKEWQRVLRPDGRILIFDANWNLRYFYEEHMRMYEEDERAYVEKYGELSPNEKYTDKMHDFRRSMPMNSRIRPQWDFEKLIELGFTKICCDLDISHKVCDEAERLRYRSRSMFMLSVGK